MINTILKIGPALLLLCLVISCGKDPQGLRIHNEYADPSILYGIEKLLKLEEREPGSIPAYDLTCQLVEAGFEPESYRISAKNTNIEVTAGDAAGIMYALLDLKEQLELGGAISSKEEAPNLSFRAIKFNLPWDSYRNGEALDLHYETCRDTIYWEAFLDMMAENRFNKLTLWNLHPFNYLVKTKKYPEACSFSDEEMEEWENFWHTLFRMAKTRNIETYLVNWNIFVSPEFAEAHDVSPISLEHGHLGPGDTSEVVKDYFRECVREVIDTYPDLTGLGITLGEGMGGMTPEEREKWLLESYIEGVRQASRKIKFIHRVPLSAGEDPGGSTSVTVEKMTRATLDTLTCFDGPMNIELKFNWSHAHSSPHLVKVHGGKLSDTYWNPLPDNYYLAWMIRNEDIFMLRWGQPDFIRRHIAENTPSYVNGYYVGSECYIPAKDYITSLKGASYRYAFERQWMYYKTWGRLLYNSETPDSFFEQAFERRFPGLGEALFESQRKVSKVPLIIASFINGAWDFTVYSEGFIGFNHGEPPAVKLLSLKTLANRAPLDPDYMSVSAFVGGDDGAANGLITPLQLADSLETLSLAALQQMEGIDAGNNIDLRYEISDIRAWAHLGKYFSNKLRAAAAYRQYQSTGDSEKHDQAVRWLTAATADWRALVEVTAAVYEPVPLMHYTFRRDNDLFHWSVVEKEVIEELAWLKGLNL